MNHLATAKDNMNTVSGMPTEEHWTIQDRLRADAEVHALIAIAENSVGIFASLSALTSHLAVIAEQLEKMNNRNEIKDNWEENLALWKEDK